MSHAIDLKGLVRPHLIEVKKRDDAPHIAEFILQPLERGYGHTLGNAMRRMLLSSLRGSAVWGFRIDGVVHEHQTIVGVVEDVHHMDEATRDLLLRLSAAGADKRQVLLVTHSDTEEVFAPIDGSIASRAASSRRAVTTMSLPAWGSSASAAGGGGAVCAAASPGSASDRAVDARSRRKGRTLVADVIKPDSRYVTTYQ